jgi:hypothetical protein
MKKVKAFLHIFVNSLLPQTNYYQKILKTKFSFSLKYFLFLTFLINCLFVLFFVIKIPSAKVNRLLTNLNNNLTAFPNNLIISVKNGSLLTTFNRPYFLWIDFDNMKQLLAVVDETADTQKINEYQSAFLLTTKFAVIRDMMGGRPLTVIPLSQIKDVTIDKNTIEEMRTNLAQIAKLLPLFYWGLIVIAIILFPMFSFLVNILYLITASLFIYIVYRIFFAKSLPRHHLSFKKTFQIGLHAITLPLIIDYGLTLLNLRSKPTMLMYLFLIAVFVFAGLYEAYFDIISTKTKPGK